MGIQSVLGQGLICPALLQVTGSGSAVCWETDTSVQGILTVVFLPLNVLICVSFGLSAETYPYLDTYTNNVDRFLTVLEGVSGLMWRGFREFGGLIFFSENDVF